MKKKLLLITSTAILFPLITLGALPIFRTEQGGTGQNSSAWDGVVYTTGGVWNASSTITLDNLTVNNVMYLAGQVDPGSLYVASGTNPVYGFATDTDTGVGTITDDTITLMTANNHRLFIDPSGNIAFGTTTLGGIFTVGTTTGNAIFNITTEGNVGIGTTGPATKLEVAGTFQVSGGNAASFQGAVTLGNGNDNVSINGSQLYAPGTGNVGIGTSSPTGLLHVATSTDALYINTEGNIAFGTTTLAGIFTVGTSSDPFFNITTEGNLSVGTSTSQGIFTVGTTTGNAIFNITSEGYVGIGTTGPEASLQVAENSSGVSARFGITSGRQLDIIGSSSYYAGIEYPGSDSGLMFPSSSMAYFGADGSSSTYSLRINLPSGNVEIGSGNVVLSGSWLSGDGNNEGVYVASDGNVGIGTTTPLTLLQVSNTANATSTITIGAETSIGCLKMRDTDGAGYTYITALDGVLTASQVACE